MPVKMIKLAAVIVLVLGLASQAFSARCVPGKNCKPPNCRCWDDPSIPGGLAPSDVPQMVLISFGYGVNRANVDSYMELFDGVTNPNSCKPRGTFFVNELNTDFSVVARLYHQQHEIAITTPNGTIPRDKEEWKRAFADMKAKVVGAGVPKDAVKGTRGPELFFGGNEQMDSLEKNKLEYDSTCVSSEYIESNNLLWPYTYDFIDNTPACTNGKPLTKAYAGKWQFLVADAEYNGTLCAVPTACSYKINNTRDAFQFLLGSFARHYDGPTRAPFLLFIDPVWLSVDHQRRGTKQFINFLRATYKDTWIVNHQQALAWIKNPVKANEAFKFKPWNC